MVCGVCRIGCRYIVLVLVCGLGSFIFGVSCVAGGLLRGVCGVWRDVVKCVWCRWCVCSASNVV